MGSITEKNVMRSENYSISSHIKQLQEEVILRVILIWTKLSQRLCLSVWIARPLCLRVSVCLSEWVSVSGWGLVWLVSREDAGRKCLQRDVATWPQGSCDSSKMAFWFRFTAHNNPATRSKALLCRLGNPTQGICTAVLSSRCISPGKTMLPREKARNGRVRCFVCISFIKIITHSSFPVSEKQSGNTLLPPGEVIADNKGKNVDLRGLG